MATVSPNVFCPLHCSISLSLPTISSLLLLVVCLFSVAALPPTKSPSRMEESAIASKEAVETSPLILTLLSELGLICDNLSPPCLLSVLVVTAMPIKQAPLSSCGGGRDNSSLIAAIVAIAAFGTLPVVLRWAVATAPVLSARGLASIVYPSDVSCFALSTCLDRLACWFFAFL